MVQEQLQAARSAWEAFATGAPSAEAIAAHWDDGVVYEEDPSWPGAGTVTGAAAVFERFMEYREILGEEIAITLEEVIAARDGFVAVLRFAGRTPGGSVPWERRWGYHFRMRDGRIIWFRAYYDAQEAFAAAS